MPTYRKRPPKDLPTMTAMKVTKDCSHELLEFFGATDNCAAFLQGNTWVVELESEITHRCPIGRYLVKTKGGEYLAVDGESFEKDYELIDGLNV